jgi:hypothetical protein
MSSIYAAFLRGMRELDTWGEVMLWYAGRARMDKSDHRHRSLLRAHRDGPCGCRSAAKQNDEFPPSHA